MRLPKYRIFGKCILCGLWFLIIVTESLGMATLTSVRKGGRGNQSWAVLSFDEKVYWIGASQSEEGRLSLYFIGLAGAYDGSRVTLDPVRNREIDVRQVRRSPSIFRSDVLYAGQVPIAVFKNSRHIVIAFQADRLIEGIIQESHQDVSPTPGHLVDITSTERANQTLTTFAFDGSYDWVGYMRPNASEAMLLFRGAEFYGINDEYAFQRGALQSVSLASPAEIGRGFRADMRFQAPASYSIARRPRELIVETSSVDAQSLVASEASASALMESSGVAFTPEITESESPPADVLSLFDDESESTAGTLDLDTESSTGSQWDFGTETAAQAAAAEEPVSGPAEIPWDDVVSFRFTDVPIRSALRMLARGSELNMVIGEGVTGKVTLDLTNVTLRQALNKIVHTNDCDYIVDKGIITVKPVKTVYTGGFVTRVYRLKYADAVNVAKVIRNMVTDTSQVQVFHHEFLNFSNAGQNRKRASEVAVQGIRRSSVIVVTDRPERIRDVEVVIQQLDRPPVQILIESRLVEMAPIEANQLGINWDKTLTTVLQWQDLLPNGDPQSYSFLNENPDGGGRWQTGHLSASEYKAVLDFLKEKTDSKLISYPRILAMDNEESSISVGTTVPVPRIQRGLGGQGDMVTFEYKEVNVQLNVTPHLAGDDRIMMYVNPVIEEITGWVEYLQHRAPITDKRTVNSIVSVLDGETVVIGGLIKNQRIRTRQKVWLLGSIPLLGNLFQHERFEDKKTELMIFITPRIIPMG